MFLSFDGKQSPQLPAFAFPAVAAHHLPTAKAWIGKLAGDGQSSRAMGIEPVRNW